ncbi:MAG: DUF4252 domain-containing protein [Saprospiraceae bacterium]|nr:DUF4252 domain-containing protein [Saprospiraceae bacterium]
MRKILFVAALIGAASLSFAQTKAIANFYDKYKSMEHVTDLKLRGWVLKLASSFSDDAQEAQLLRKISQLRILTMENGNLVSPNEYKNLIKNIKQEAFEELFQVRDDGQTIEFLIREKGDTITDVLMLVSGDDGFIMLSLEGALKFSDLNDLNIEVEGSEHFKKLPDDKKAIPKA